MKLLRTLPSLIDPDTRYAPLVFLAIVILKLASLDNLFYWDEAGAYIQPSLVVADRGLWLALPGLHEKGQLAGHPPLLYLVHGGIYQIFGNMIIPHRIAAIFFAWIGVWYTYRLGKLLCNRSTGVAAALLLLFSPMYFAQSSMVLGDLPIAALGVMSAYFLFAERRVAFVIASILLLQTKETALAISVAAAIYWFLLHPKDGNLWGSVLMHAIPLSSLAVFFGLEYIGTGAFIQASYFGTYPFLPFALADPVEVVGQILRQARWVGWVIFVGEGRFLLTAIILAGLLFHRRAVWKPQFAFFGLVALLYWAAFSLIVFLPRYVMPVLPFTCIAAAWSLYVLVRERASWQLAASGMLVLAFMPFLFFWSESGNLETNLRHAQAISVTSRACAYVEKNLRDAIIVADWPISAYLRIPELGYVRARIPRVQTAMGLRFAQGFEDDGRLLPLRPSEAPLAFVYGPFRSSQEAELLRSHAARERLRLIKRFDEGNLFTEIYLQELSPRPGGE